MEVGFEGEDGERSGGSGGGGEDGGSMNRPKRQMKTPFQLENLERTYAMENYPTEATRADLSEKLGLSDRQLQMWFCHRRLKDKKEAAGMAAMKPRVPVAFGKNPVPESLKDDMIDAEMGSDHGSGSGSESESGSSRFDNGGEIPTVPVRYFESPRTIMERRAIACIEAQLGEPLSEDGPILGVEFDELPPGAFGAPIVAAEQQKPYRPPYDSKLYAQYESKQIKATPGPKIRSDAYGHGQVAPPYLYDSAVAGPTSKTLPLMQGNGHRDHGNEGQMTNVAILPQQGKEGNDDLIPPIDDILLLERKRKMEEARIEREVQSNEKRMRKEIEKQDLLRKKREEQFKKEMERQNRERQKEEQRLIREQQRREERYLREEKREMERREKFMQKELIRAERRKQKEEIRLEREAVKQKLALEKAAARKFAKESMELIEDERLELMELAASSKGLPSILALDYNTLQNLEAFRESLCEFPPKSVKLKKPFAFQPWANSQENIGNLLMVWRFCLTFADILGLWPFTLDEFVQAFHDYDSRLLGEVHIALLKLIIKDIEDVARTPSGGPGTNQYSAVNPEGGHPKLVEGAYLWGFDIRNWQKLLNPLTWPEILRQFSLSAGYGPQLKKKSSEKSSANDNDETKGCEEIVSNLRSGAAAESAVAIIHEKGFSLQRKSRHRLTPGTVKFAAYHVLALEGSKGLNVVDLAEKIQRSGLRDLTTSKTPEASISVALSRDPILFERIAPSTYNVRPAYRKDPADADAILASAREKIQKFANGLLTEQNVEEEEREDDSECDVAEGPEIEDIGTPDVSTLIEQGNEIATCSGTLKDALSVDLIPQPEVNGVATIISEPDQEDAEIDESKSGEPWVQGLTEGEYSDLCVEERLKALTALIGVANEGNTVRIVLEDRLDAVNALKKQMWAEAQLDKKRMKEEFISKFQDSSLNVTAERLQSPLVTSDGKNYDTPVSHVVKEEGSVTADSVHNPYENTPGGKYFAQDSGMAQSCATPAQQNGYTAERSRMQLKSFIGHKAEEMYVYRSLPLGQDRRRNRYWQFVASASSQDPGSGRIFMESTEGLWRLIDTEEAFDSLVTSLDTRGIRESHLHIMLQKIEGPFRERLRRDSSYVSSTSHNRASKTEADEENSFSPANSICGSPSVTQCTTDSDSLEPSVSFRIELARNDTEKLNAFKRYKNLQIWMWEECFNTPILCTKVFGKRRCSAVLGVCDSCLGSYTSEENYCTSCRKSFGKETHLEDLKVDPKNVVVLNSPHPTRIRLIRAIFNFLEAFVPSEALQSSWTEETRKAWGLKLQSASCAEDFLQIMTQFESIIRRDYLSETFETSMELSSYCSPSKNSANVEHPRLGIVAPLPWIPRTTAAVALRLVELDYSISCVPEQRAKLSDGKKADEVLVPATYDFPNDVQKVDPDRLFQEENWASVNNIHSRSQPKQASRGRGSGGRPRGKSQRVGLAASMAHPGRQTTSRDESLAQTLHRERTYGQKHGRGRRTLRKRRIEKKIVQEIVPGGPLEKSLPRIAELPRNTHEEFTTPNFGRIESDNDDDSNSMDADDYPDNGQDTRFDSRRWEAGFHDSSRNNDIEESSEEDSSDSDSEGEQEREQERGNGANVDEDVEMNDYDSDRVAAGHEDADSDSADSQDYSD